MQCFWPLPPSDIALSAGEVHLWAASLDPPDDLWRRCEGVLSEDERCRAERFRAGPLRSRYIAGRGMLRILLARYLRTEPASMSLGYQAHGKPELAPPWNAAGIELNSRTATNWPSMPLRETPR